MIFEIFKRYNCRFTLRPISGVRLFPFISEVFRTFWYFSCHHPGSCVVVTVVIYNSCTVIGYIALTLSNQAVAVSTTSAAIECNCDSLNVYSNWFTIKLVISSLKWHRYFFFSAFSNLNIKSLILQSLLLLVVRICTCM